jgi:diguanylate cyclase (GGDEF)-like protein
MSLKDPVTGLKNRRFFLEIIKPEAAQYADQLVVTAGGHSERREARDSIYGVFLIDIDHFKRVNDSFGHDSGDLLLRQFSDLLSELIRTNDLVIRWGGEEFLVILRNTTPDYLPTFAEVLRQKVEGTIFTLTSGGTISRTCSIGFVPYPFDPRRPRALDFEQAITLADRLLDYAKNHGRNISVGASPAEGVQLDEGRVGTITNSFDRAVFDDIIEINIWGR